MPAHTNNNSDRLDINEILLLEIALDIYSPTSCCKDSMLLN